MNMSSRHSRRTSTWVSGIFLSSNPMKMRTGAKFSKKNPDKHDVRTKKDVRFVVTETKK